MAKATDILNKVAREDKENLLDDFFSWYKSNVAHEKGNKLKYIYPFPMLAIAEECCQLYNDHYSPKHKAEIVFKGLK